jgi:hypothetical protein
LSLGAAYSLDTVSDIGKLKLTFLGGIGKVNHLA